MSLLLHALVAAGLGIAGGGGNDAELPSPPVRHGIAFINDPLSHGHVGDGLLSLNEVIQLHNRTLQTSQLSLAEQNQIIGIGLDIYEGDIDAMVTPTVTVERDLDVIVDVTSGHGILFTGRNGKPLIDFSQTSRGFLAQSNYCDWRGLVIHGSTSAIDVIQTSAQFGTTLQDVDFENQSVVGFRVTMSGGGAGRVIIGSCTFTNLPVAIRIDETAAARATVFYVETTRMTNVLTGVDVLLGPGGSSYYEFQRIDFATASNGIRFSRPNGADRAITLLGLYLRIAAAAPFEYEGGNGSLTQATLRMLDLQSTAAPGTALAVFPDNSGVSGDIDELRADGGVQLAAGLAQGPLTLGNARLKNGSCTLVSNGPDPLLVVDSRFDAMQVTTRGFQPISVDTSCFVGGSLSGSAGAPLQLDICYVGIVPGANVVRTNQLAAAQLGSMLLLPLQPTLGQQIVMQADLPPGLFGFFAMGPTNLFPVIQPRPMHVYLDLQYTYVFPGIYRLQQTFAFTVPNNPALIESDWVCQMAVLPDPTMTAPPLALPPGRRFALQ